MFGLIAKKVLEIGITTCTGGTYAPIISLVRGVIEAYDEEEETNSDKWVEMFTKLAVDMLETSAVIVRDMKDGIPDKFDNIRKALAKLGIDIPEETNPAKQAEILTELVVDMLELATVILRAMEGGFNADEVDDIRKALAELGKEG